MKKIKKIFYPHWHEKNHFVYNNVELQKIRGADNMKKYEEIIVEEICGELSLKERIIVRLFKRIFIKVYKIGITFGYNNK